MTGRNTTLGNIDLNLLVVFETLIENRSVQRAAEQLGCTPSAVSHALGRLRRMCNDPLLVRTATGMQPTTRGQELAEAVTPSLRQLHLALTAANDFEPSSALRTFQVATGTECPPSLLSSALEVLTREAPGIQLNIRPLTSGVTAMLADGSVDMVIGEPAPEIPGLSGTPLFTDQLYVMVREGHPDVRDTLTLSQYLNLRHVSLSSDGGEQHGVDRVLAQQGLSRRVALTLPDPLSAARMVVGSDMALTAGRRVLAHVADRSPVRILPVPFLSHGVKVGLSWPVRLSREAAHVWLRGRLQTLFQDRH